jgi:hypothetical protein
MAKLTDRGGYGGITSVLMPNEVSHCSGMQLRVGRKNVKESAGQQATLGEWERRPASKAGQADTEKKDNEQ